MQSFAAGQDTAWNTLWIAPFGLGTALVAFQALPFHTWANVPSPKVPTLTQKRADRQDTETSSMFCFPAGSGVGVICHFLPFQCSPSVRCFAEPFEDSPTASGAWLP